MLKGEYLPFQYMIVYIAVLQVCQESIHPAGPTEALSLAGVLTLTVAQGGLGAGQWLSYGPSKLAV